MKDKFIEYSNERLVDIVKNAKSYGYTEDIVNSALDILKDRGIDDETLRLQGNLSNQQYDDSEVLFKSFDRYSKAAFVFYFALLILNVFSSISNSLALDLFIIIFFLGFILLMIKSLMEQSKFYEKLKINRSPFDTIIYFLVGMPLYFVMFFYYRSKMKAEMYQLK